MPQEPSKNESTPFDQVIDRRPSNSTKWNKYKGRDILPFWVADMDFATPEFIHAAVQERLEHPILGYSQIPEQLTESACDWLWRRYQWRVPPESLVWLAGVVPGLNQAARSLMSAGDALVIPEPVYHPFRAVAANAGCEAYAPRLLRDGPRWVMDLDQMHAQLPANARLLLLCNPQNPTGRAYTRAELQELGTFCLEHDLYLCADEIHCELLLDPAVSHTPIASLDPALAQRTISLFAPTKTFNMPGLGCAFAVILDEQMRERFITAQSGLAHSSGPLAYAAAQAAFEYEGPWVKALLAYLKENHDRVYALLESHLPGRMTPVEATYLAWFDLREFAADNTPFATGPFFEEHGLGISDGAAFGGDGFARFNFAAPRSTLDAGLVRLEAALKQLLGR